MTGVGAMKYLLCVIWSLLSLGALSSTILFILQGGFGGGHLRFDHALYLLSLPWNYMPMPECLLKHDWVHIIAIPWSMNTILVVIVTIVKGQVIAK